MRCRPPSPPLRNLPALAAAFAALVLAILWTGCSREPEEVVIEPAPAGSPADTGLGPGVGPLSSGPGGKGYPRVGPSGDRLSFVLDGRVVEKSLYARGFEPQSPSELQAEGAEWAGEDLVVLGENEAGSSTLFSLGGPEDSPTTLLEEVVALDALPEGKMIAAVKEPGGVGSRLLLVRDDGRTKLYPEEIPGRVTGLAASPDGERAALAVEIESGEEAGRVELRSYGLPAAPSRRVALLDEGTEVLGAPQWTSRGMYFVAGRAGDQGSYALYRVPEEGSEEPVQGLGEGFLPSSIAASPDGDRLAIIGRRNPSSPTDLYVLEPDSDILEAVTANEGMEVKTDPGDLSWAPDGSYVVLIARRALSGPAVYGGPAASLSSPFYNLYRVPAEAPPE